MNQIQLQDGIREKGRLSAIVKIVSAFAVLFWNGSARAQFHQNLSFRSFNNNVVDCGTLAGTFANATAYTVEARVKFNSFSTWSNVFSRRTSDLERDIVLQSYSTTGSMGISVATGYAYSTTHLTLGVWYHLAIVYDGTQTGDSARLKLYIDGVQDSLNFLSVGNVPAVSPSATNARFTIGAEYNGTTPITGSTFVLVPFDGAVDELRIWNIARTQGAIVADMNTELTLPQPNLATYYQFNQGSACGANAGLTTVPDLAGTNNGTLWNFLLSGTQSNYTTVVDTAVTVGASALTALASPATYQWFDCNSNSILGGQTAGTYTTPGSSNVAVIVTQDFCVDTSSCYAVTITGLGEDIAQSRPDVFPNPSDGNFTVILPEKGGEIVVLDVAGSEVLRTLSGETLQSIQLGTGGIYFIRIQTKSRVITRKVLVK